MARKYTGERTYRIVREARENYDPYDYDGINDLSRYFATTNRDAADGRFLSRGDRGAYRTIARFLSRDASRRGTDIHFLSGQETRAMHRGRYRGIRAALGMSGG